MKDLKVLSLEVVIEESDEQYFLHEYYNSDLSQTPVCHLGSSLRELTKEELKEVLTRVPREFLE